MKALPPPDEPKARTPSEILTKAGDILKLQPDGTYKRVHNYYWNTPTGEPLTAESVMLEYERIRQRFASQVNKP